MFNLNDPKLIQLAEIEGFSDPLDFVEAYHTDGIVPAICMNRHCEATADLEPDMRNGRCEACGTPTMRSGLIIAGFV